MARIETWFDQDLKNPVPVRVLTGSAFSLDNLGNLIGVKVTDGGEIITLAGSVTGYCMLADGQTVTVAGTRSGNMASIVLPQTAYTVPGPIRISIKLTDGSAITTLLACVGTVVRTQTGNIVNPGSVVQDWSTQISAQLQACQDAADNMGAMVAVAFNPSSVYSAGNYVTYNGGMYRITAAHEAGTTWANTSKTQVTVGAELSDLNRAFTNELLNGNAFDILPFCDHSNQTHRGVTFTWNADNTVCTVNGTATGGASVDTFFDQAYAFPKGVSAGSVCRLKYSATNVKFQAYAYIGGVLDTTNVLASITSNKDFTVPSNASGLFIRLAVSSGVTANESVSPKLFTETLTNKELDDAIDAANESIDGVIGETYANSISAAGETANATLNRLNVVGEWVYNTYLDANDGKIKPLSDPTIYKSCSRDMISVPSGTKIHVHNAERIAKYAADGTFIAAITTPRKDELVSCEDAAYVRIQYASISPSTLNSYVAYRYSAIDEAQSLNTKLDENRESAEQSGNTAASVSGNPLVLKDCDPNKPFDNFEVSGKVSGESVVISRKNIFAIRHVNGTFTKNNVNFQYNTINHTIRIYTSGNDHASADTTDGFADFGPEFSKVNDVTFYHDFKFKFAADTRVAVSDNPNREVPFDWGVQMRIYDGTTIYNVGTGGVSFVAEAGKEYVAYFLVKGPNTTDPGNSYPGWSGDITYAPQIEISPYPTAYERFSGLEATLNYAGEENIFTCGGVGPGRYTTQNGAIMALYDSTENAVYLNAHNDSSGNVLIYDTAKDGKVNGQDFYYVSKFMAGRIAESLSDYISNGGKLTIGKNDLESGQWSYSTKAANAARARSTSLIPVTAGTVVSYSNTTFDTYFGVLPTTSSGSYAQIIGWKTDGTGSFTIAQDGYMTFIIRNHADTTATVDINDYDSTVIVQPPDMPVFVSTFDNRLARKVFAQLYDGETVRVDYNGQGFFVNGEIGREYALRYCVRANADVNCVIKPAISTGIYALKARCASDNAVIYSDGSASFTVRRREISTKAKAERNMGVANAVMALTGGHILTPFSKLTARGPIVSFIDDDTSNYQYVKYYHDIFAAQGELGGYAVETKNLDEGVSDGLPELLLDYEEEGFACLYHCYHQAGNETRYWINGHPDYNPALINENFMHGLRSIREYGFSNYKYWVTPYGVNDKFIVDLAKNHGMQCLLNCPSRYAQEGVITPYGNVSRWNIPRVIFGNYHTDEAWAAQNTWLHRAIREAKAANGWVIIVSHVNSWGWTRSGDQRLENDDVLKMKAHLNDLIDYCQSEGLEIVPFPVGFEEYRASFYMNELF